MRTAAFYALAATQLVAAHTTFQSLVIGGKDQGQHKGVRTPSNGNNPIYDVTSSAMICNGGSAAADTVSVAAGSSIGMQWHHNDPQTATNDADEPIAASHKGPVMVYIAPAASNGQGNVWVKIYEDGYSGGKWGVDNFIANKGIVTATLPNLAPGDYLIRPEMIGLHEASAEKKAQFYNGCAQIKVTGSGTVKLPAGVDMTKAYSATDPGVKFNIYGTVTSYKVPGPAVWNGQSGSATSGDTQDAPKPSASAASTPSPVVGNVTPSATAAPAPSSGSDLPEQFTIKQFITWLESKTGTAAAKRFARSLTREHARQFL